MLQSGKNYAVFYYDLIRVNTPFSYRGIVRLFHIRHGFLEISLILINSEKAAVK